MTFLSYNIFYIYFGGNYLRFHYTLGWKISGKFWMHAQNPEQPIWFFIIRVVLSISENVVPFERNTFSFGKRCPTSSGVLPQNRQLFCLRLWTFSQYLKGYITGVFTENWPYYVIVHPTNTNNNIACLIRSIRKVTSFATFGDICW